MAKRTISAKAIVEDIRAGLRRSDLMQKYGIRDQNLTSLLTKLLEIGALDRSEIVALGTQVAPINNSPQSSPLSATKSVHTQNSHDQDFAEKATSRSEPVSAWIEGTAASETTPTKQINMEHAPIGHEEKALFKRTIEELDAGANVDQRDQLGQTALMRMAAKGHLSVVELLLRNGADANARAHGGFTACMEAADNKQWKIVDLLLRKTAQLDIHAKDYQDGLNVLMVAIMQGAPREIIESLIAKGSSIDERNKHGATPLLLAAGNGNAATAQLLLDNGAYIEEQDQFDRTALHLAMDNGYSELAELLINRGANVNSVSKKKLTPLAIAAGKGYRDLVGLLLSKGADPLYCPMTEDGITALEWASLERQLEIVRMLLKSGANKSSFMCEPCFIRAIARGELELIELFLNESRMDANRQCSDGFTMLMIAAENGHAEAAELLIKRGADVHWKSPKGDTAVSIALKKGHRHVVQLLQRYGAKLGFKDGIKAALLR